MQIMADLFLSYFGASVEQEIFPIRQFIRAREVGWKRLGLLIKKHAALPGKVIHLHLFQALRQFGGVFYRDGSPCITGDIAAQVHLKGLEKPNQLGL